MALTFPTVRHFISTFVSHEQHFSAQIAGWLKWKPLAEVVLEHTLWGQCTFHPLPNPKPSSGYFSEEVGTDHVTGQWHTGTVGRDSVHLEEVVSSSPCVMDLNGS